ncbi:MAG TPA: DNA polymerase III subunit delta' [Tepidiformaceae bacterium]|nr:DNA polymerase III subunit delta' [Tepidiformaceae bacterium]
MVGSIIGHEAIIRELRTLAATVEPPHALLFAGPDRVGRGLLARTYAMLLNCDFASSGPRAGDLSAGALPCGECRPCRLIAEGAHPDVLTLEPGDVLCRPRDGESHAKHPDSRDIRICQVRGLIELVARFPFEARYRAVIIDPAERMNREAANTLLKTLEEPPGHTVFALISSAPELIPETIVSRCRRIDVTTVDRATIEAGLTARGVAPGLAQEAAEAARGRPGVAITFAEQPDLMGDRGRLAERCATVAAANVRERFRYAGELADRWRQDRSSVTRELDAWDSYWEGQLAAAAADGNEAAARGALDGLRAVRLAGDDLLAQVVPRLALEYMLLSFPRGTLAAGPSAPDKVYV